MLYYYAASVSDTMSDNLNSPRRKAATNCLTSVLRSLALTEYAAFRSSMLPYLLARPRLAACGKLNSKYPATIVRTTAPVLTLRLSASATMSDLSSSGTARVKADIRRTPDSAKSLPERSAVYLFVLYLIYYKDARDCGIIPNGNLVLTKRCRMVRYALRDPARRVTLIIVNIDSKGGKN